MSSACCLKLGAWRLWLAVGLTRLYPNAILLRITSKTNWTTDQPTPGSLCSSGGGALTDPRSNSGLTS